MSVTSDGAMAARADRWVSLWRNRSMGVDLRGWQDELRIWCEVDLQLANR